MGSEDRDGQSKAQESGGGHPHERAAAELSGRAADSVDRRYDATKESTREPHSHEDEPGDGPAEDGTGD